MPFALLLLGGAIAIYSLWQLRRWLQEAERQWAAGPRRLEAIAEELIATAEGTSAAVAEKTEALEAAMARANAVLARYDAAMAGGEPPRQTATAPAPRKVAAPRVKRPAAEVPARPAAVATEALPAPAPIADIPEAHRRVYNLADSGLDVTAIARQLSLTKGEVQLILGLRRMN